MNELLTTIALPVTFILVALIKKTGRVEKKYLPLVSMGIGVIISLILALKYGHDPLLAVLNMVLIGSAPVAAHEIVKNSRKQ